MLSFQYNDNKYYKNNQTKNEEKPAFGQPRSGGANLPAGRQG